MVRALRVDVCLIPPALCHHEARLRGDFLQALHSAAVVKVTVRHKDHLEIRGVHAARLDIREQLIHKRFMHRVNQHRARRRLDEPRGHPIHADVIDAVKGLIGVDLLSFRVREPPPEFRRHLSGRPELREERVHAFRIPDRGGSRLSGVRRESGESNRRDGGEREGFKKRTAIHCVLLLIVFRYVHGCIIYPKYRAIKT